MFIIIPAKPFAEAKTRLAPILTPAQRRQVSRRLLLRTIGLARQVGPVVVISRDRLVRRLAKRAGAWALVELSSGLNQALQQATRWVLAREGEVLVVLPGDLPLLTRGDLHELIRLGQAEPAVVIAPCHRTEGTNALLLRPPDLLDFYFGPGSFVRHQQAARVVGVEATIFSSPTLAFDLDLPEDVMALSQQGRMIDYR